MDERKNLLYDKDGRVEYIGAERVKAILIGYDHFIQEVLRFERSREEGLYRKACATDLMEEIKIIRAVIPNEIRGALPEHFRLSNKDLGLLEERCKIVLDQSPFISVEF